MRRWPALALAALALVGCARRPARVVFGIALTKSSHPAVILARKEINAAGGIGGVPLELAGLDWSVRDEFDPADILRRVAQFDAMPGLLAVIGPSDSASTLSAAASLNQRGLPEIVTIATHPAITRIGDYTYRLCVSDAAQGPALADYAVHDWGKRRAAVFHVNDDYGWGLAHHFEKRMAQLGKEVVAAVPLRNELDAEDRALVRATARRLAADPPDLVVLLQRVGAAHQTLLLLREAGITADVLCGDNLMLPSFWQNRMDLKQGVRLSSFFLASSQAQPGDWGSPGASAESHSFVERFRAERHADPDYGHAFAYDAVHLLRDAVLHGGYSRQGVKAYLDRLVRDQEVIDGVTGAYKLGADHDAKRRISIVEIHGKGLRFLKSVRAG